MAPPARLRAHLRSRSRPRLVVMVKEPRPGRVKTRLGAGIGMVPAARWFRGHSLALIRRLAADPRWETILAVTPDREGLDSRVWPAHLRRWPQGRGDLGARMARALREAPPGPVAIVGADIPGIRRRDVAAAFVALGRAEAVFGPAEDGGYWLIGLSSRARARARRGLFDGVRWSTDRALADSERALAGARIARIRRLRDVDTAADLALVDKPRLFSPFS